MTKFSTSVKITKVDADLGLVMGFAIVSLENGEPYFDLQDDHIPEDVMLEASLDFMENSQIAKEMHSGEQVGAVVFAWPMTTEIAKSFDIVVKKTGLMIAMKPSDPEMLERFRKGDLTGFSIGGTWSESEEIDA